MDVVEQITKRRIEREQRAAARAARLPNGDYFALDGKVVEHGTRRTVVECESHWDACLVLLAVPFSRQAASPPA